MKDKILNYLLISFVVLLSLNLLLPKPETKTAPVVTGAYIEVAASAGTIPALPVVSIVNPGSAGKINTCQDIEIIKDYMNVKLDGKALAFCKTVDIAAGGKYQLDIAPIAELFRNSGEYAIKYKNPLGGESVAKYSQSERGFFRKLFSSVFYAPILNLFVLLLTLTPNASLGFAIIGITILIRIVLLAPQHAIMISSRKMQAIQPKIKEIQDKHKGNQAEIGMKLMELYKTEGVNPLGSCLPLLLQLPVLIVLYNVINTIGDASNSFFLYQVFANFDPTQIGVWFYGMNLKAVGGITGIVLAISVGLLQWLQMKLSFAKTEAEKNKNAKVVEQKENGVFASIDPENPLNPEMMNKMMIYTMPLMIAVSTYFFPAGLGLYWFVGAIFMLVQQIVVNKMVAKK